MFELWMYDKQKQARKTHYQVYSENEVIEMIKNGLATAPEETIAKYLSPWGIYKNKKDCPFNAKRGNAVLFKNLKTGKFTRR